MAQPQFSLTWSDYKKNVCQGLSSLQQNGEFVDMTLAADGHMVQVHQVVIALASPYLKQLIASIKCPHPVIFLNRVKYPTLIALLEYVYMGEVMVPPENLNALIEAATELHIRGLEDMNINNKDYTDVVHISDAQNTTVNVESDRPQGLAQPLQTPSSTPAAVTARMTTGAFSTYKPKSEGRFRPSTQRGKTPRSTRKPKAETPQSDGEASDSNWPDSDMPTLGDMDTNDADMDSTHDSQEKNPVLSTLSSRKDVEQFVDPKTMTTQVTYTLSNCGGLQMILNRHMYNIRYTSANGIRRRWQCVKGHVNNGHCRAYVVTENDVVIKRHGAHNHPYHDSKILKKVRDRAVFSTLPEVESRMKKKKTSQGQTTDQNTSMEQECASDA